MHAAHRYGEASQTRPNGRRQLAHHVRWGSIGYAIGLLLVMPYVLWLTAAEPEPRQRLLMRDNAPVVPDLVRGPQPATRRDKRPALESNARAGSLESVRSLIAARSIERARALVQPLAEQGDGEALFLLAETFDPQQLAGLGIVEAHSDVERARHLYERALTAGYRAALGRLEQLR